MSLASNLPYNNRLVEDVNFVKAVNLRTALYTAGIDFVQVTPYPTTEAVILRADSSAISSTLDAGVTGSFTWQDSADNSSFANIPQLAGFTATGASLPATSQVVLLPPTVRRYVRGFVTLTDSGSNSTTNITGSITASVLF